MCSASSTAAASRWTQVRLLLEMIRFSHTLFALPFALLAAVMAWTADGFTRFRWLDLLGILLCMATARSAAMAFNRIVDRDIDRLNPRTMSRHLPSGQISLPAAIGFTLVCSVGFVTATLLFLPNALPLILSLPVLLFLFSYSFAKRWTSLAHLWLGVALMLAPVSTWIALRGSLVLADGWDLLPAVWLGLAVMFWVTGFDILYACQDFQFDRQHRLFSIPARFGIRGALRIAAGSHLLMVVCLLGLLASHAMGGPYVPWGWLFASCVAGVAILLVYEHALVRPDDLSRVNTAFFQVNSIISVTLFLAGTVDLLWR